MKVKYSNSIEKKVSDRLKAVKGSVVLRKDFQGTGADRQVSRALKKLVVQKKIVKIGSGVYAKAYTSKYTDSPLIKGGVDSTLRKALNRLNVRYEPSSAEKAYNAGKTTQVPVQNMVRLKSRCRRALGYGSSQLSYEKNKNAK